MKQQKFFNYLKKANIFMNFMSISVILLLSVSLILTIVDKNFLLIIILAIMAIGFYEIIKHLRSHFFKKSVIDYQIIDNNIFIKTFLKEYNFKLDSCIKVREYFDRFSCVFLHENKKIKIIFTKSYVSIKNTVFTKEDIIKFFDFNV